MPDLESTIVAVASPNARRDDPSRGIVRVSGAAALRVIASHLLWRDAPPNRGIGPALLPLGEGTLPVLALRFPAPRSFTGEDTLELQAPGSPELLERIVSELIAIGASAGESVRRAEPGEFSARAFLHGRIALDEAEGIAAAIAARGDGELRAARRLMEGRLGRLARTWSNRLVELLALLEAGIDFTDQEDVIAISRGTLAASIASIVDQIARELRRTAPEEARHGLPRVVLTGAPNAGKSSLFNALLGVGRSIVAAVSGTTRDAIEMPLAIHSPDTPGTPGAHGEQADRSDSTRWVEVLLVDTPGIDELDTDTSRVTPPGVEPPFDHDLRKPTSPGDASPELAHAMIESARTAATGADLLLRCVPADLENSPPPRARLPLGPDASPASTRDGPAPRELVVSTRIDLVAEPQRTVDATAIRTSSRTGEGLAELRRAIAEAVVAEMPLDVDAMSLEGRHRTALTAAVHELTILRAEVMGGDSPDDAPEDVELLAARLRGAIDALGAITGRVITDDVLEIVFRRFCIGK